MEIAFDLGFISHQNVLEKCPLILIFVLQNVRTFKMVNILLRAFISSPGGRVVLINL